jgi:hypothetical protein
MRLLLLTVLISVSIHTSAQTIDSVQYWHNRYDSAAYKVIAAREVLLNMQDYLNLCRKNPKLNKFSAGWIQRCLTDYFYKVHITPQPRKKPLHH